MGSAFLLAIVFALYLLLATTLGLLAGALASLVAPGGRLAAGIRVGTPVFFGAFGLVMACIIAFGSIAQPHARAKLTMLDRAASELVACAPVAVSATAVGVAAALYLAIRQLRRSTAGADRASSDAA